MNHVKVVLLIMYHYVFICAGIITVKRRLNALYFTELLLDLQPGWEDKQSKRSRTVMHESHESEKTGL